MTIPFAPPEFQVLNALFRSDLAALGPLFADGVVNIDAPRVGLSVGPGQAEALAERWPSLFNVRAGQAVLAQRFTTAAEGRFVCEVMAEVASREGAPVSLPIGVMGERAVDGLLKEVRIYHYEKAVTGEIGFRPSAFPVREDERLGMAEDMPGVNASYFRAANGGDVEGALALFTPDAWIEIGGRIFNTSAQRRRMYEFFLKDVGMQLLFSCMTYDGVNFALEWTAGHANREAGLAVYECTGENRIASIRMYDTFDPANIPGLTQGG